MLCPPECLLHLFASQGIVRHGQLVVSVRMCMCVCVCRGRGQIGGRWTAADREGRGDGLGGAQGEESLQTKDKTAAPNG